MCRNVQKNLLRTQNPAHNNNFQAFRMFFETYWQLRPLIFTSGPFWSGATCFTEEPHWNQRDRMGIHGILWFPVDIINLSMYTHTHTFPLPSIRQHLSYDDCLRDKSEDYHNCSVPYCVTLTQLCTVICTLIRAVLTMNCFRFRF